MTEGNWRLLNWCRSTPGSPSGRAGAAYAVTERVFYPLHSFQGHLSQRERQVELVESVRQATISGRVKTLPYIISISFSG